MPAIPCRIERDFIPAVRVFDGTLPAVVPAHNPEAELAGGPEALASRIRTELAKWRDVARRGNIHIG
jgi:hypothetical protein